MGSFSFSDSVNKMGIKGLEAVWDIGVAMTQNSSSLSKMTYVQFVKSVGIWDFDLISVWLISIYVCWLKDTSAKQKQIHGPYHHIFIEM